MARAAGEAKAKAKAEPKAKAKAEPEPKQEATEPTKADKKKKGKAAEDDYMPNEKGFFGQPMRFLTPFVAFVVMFIVLMIIADPCATKQSKRKDCGYPSVSMPMCLTGSKFYKVGGAEELGKVFGTFGAVGFVAWLISGYEPGSLFLYAVMSALLALRIGGCCYDSNVKGSVPHCYMASGMSGALGFR
eukprot:gnl/TRDRNA2_/TRDRNA2_185265_c0_seq1.p2 gnl/TRDRNA2_/TRDRNA2_185265_c0~~gnl/TRDRNA2_/TRDRNA2_185265_c0_seq1.p2  ORF type:complete len:188 (+),score=45.50 gnl/TRDRNA2_/TRDRNA2_185265_c0_seq1:81-644(+)